MARKNLNVFLNEHLVGKLVQDEHGTISFSYLDSWIAKANSFPISYSLPLQKDPFNPRVCHSFFGGILPEYEKRELIARNLGISAKNDFSMLESIGGECAGAITFLPEEETISFQGGYEKLSEDDLYKILAELPRKPLLAGRDGVRLSLAGAQDKIVVFADQDSIYLPIGTQISSHIIKPAIDRFADIVWNEYFCLKLATELKIPTVKAEIKKVYNIDYLMIERYDRLKIDGHLIRVHQEDFCQALGIASENKYQNEGGPSFKQCFQLIRDFSSIPAVDSMHLLDAVIFNYLIGNNDAHGKNFSLLYRKKIEKLEVRLTPLYDLISTSIYDELSNKMAMKIGGEYIAEKVTSKNWKEFSNDCNLSSSMVFDRIKQIAIKLIKILENYKYKKPSEYRIHDLIKARCLKVTEGF